MELAKVAESKIPKPHCAYMRAFVDEKIATRIINEIGLMNHHGIAPAPPGFARNTSFAKPPGREIPGSVRKRDG